VTINLAAADVKRDSSGLDLPIAVACMLARGVSRTAGVARSFATLQAAVEIRTRLVDSLHIV